MLSEPLKLAVIGLVIACAGLQLAVAKDTATIRIPMRSRLTPVQQLNREGVEAIKKHDVQKAESLFYKAYLYDPADPFTLNNLGYISELQGQLDRATRFYGLAAEQGSTADIDLSNVKRLEGQPMNMALGNLRDTRMQVNRINVEVMRLLSENRGSEAADMLRGALMLDPSNPFTLNNLGVAEEEAGDYESALRDYRSVASSRSPERVVVTPDRSWSGRTVTEMAASNAARLETRMRGEDAKASEAAMFSTRGVMALNQNDSTTAKEDFMRAFLLDPVDAFSLNNRGYVAELDGDPESAQFFYEKAQKAHDANLRVGLASRSAAQGKSLFAVAEDSDNMVDHELEKYSQERHGETSPIELTPRGNGDASDPAVAPGTKLSPNQPSSEPDSSPQPVTH